MVMLKLKQLFCILFISVCLFGCQTIQVNDQYYKPLNRIQEEFYNLQTMYESGNFNGVVDLGEQFVLKYQRDILTVAVKYYLADSYQKLGEFDKSNFLFKAIEKTNPTDEWGKLAVVGLKENESLQKG